MKSIWEIDESVLQKISNIVTKYRTSNLAKERIKRNIEKNCIDLSQNNVWKILIGCEITTQQKSGEGSKVNKFLKSNKKIFDFNYCKDHPDIISEELRNSQLRRHLKIAEWLKEIIIQWENGEWKNLEKKLNLLKKEHTKEDELEIISYLRNGKYKGLGPKQSRNFLQWLGLSIYEIPIDSRTLKVLKKCECNFVPGAAALQDEITYEYLEKGLQLVSEKLNILPCLLDACFFASLEKQQS